MDEAETAFAERYRRWIDLEPPDPQRAAALWRRLAKRLELDRGPTSQQLPGKRP